MGYNPRVVKTQPTGDNSRAMSIQRTGIDPRAKIAHFHLQDSMRIKGYNDNAQTSDDQLRSVSGNVFRRLGRGQI